MKQYNLAGEEIEVGLRKIGAIQDVDNGPEGRFTLSIQCEGLPLNPDAILLIDSRKTHWTEYKRRRKNLGRAGNPVFEGNSRCNHCRSEKEPVWNTRGKLFECPDCSCTSFTKVAGRRHIRVEHKTLKHTFKKNRNPKPVLR